MIRVRRPSAPPGFAAHAARWTAAYLEARRRNPACTWSWYSVDGQTARELLSPALDAMTDAHCAYCDSYSWYEVGGTVDHFRPKSTFPELAYSWPNLYPACTQCQKRGDRFDPLLLAPDADDYAFDRYFDFDFATGALQPAPNGSPADRARALRTIELFDLNNPQRLRARLREASRARQGAGTAEGHARAYRFIRPDDDALWG